MSEIANSVVSCCEGRTLCKGALIRIFGGKGFNSFNTRGKILRRV